MFVKSYQAQSTLAPTMSEKSVRAEAVNSLSGGAAGMEAAGCFALHSRVDGGISSSPALLFPALLAARIIKPKGTIDLCILIHCITLNSV